jgi:hypothetical protein
MSLRHGVRYANSNGRSCKKSRSPHLIVYESTLTPPKCAEKVSRPVSEYVKSSLEVTKRFRGRQARPTACQSGSLRRHSNVVFKLALSYKAGARHGRCSPCVPPILLRTADSNDPQGVEAEPDGRAPRRVWARFAGIARRIVGAVKNAANPPARTQG